MHLLLAQKGSISEGDEAFDLGQSPGDILFLSAADTEIASVAAFTNRRDLRWRLVNLASLKHPMSIDMATKTGEKGLIIIHTGKGKGKSTAGFGMIFRHIAHGMPCAVVQFIKGAMETGERELIDRHFSDLCEFHTMGEGFTWETQDRARDVAAAQAAWGKAKELISSGEKSMCRFPKVRAHGTRLVLGELPIAFAPARA